MCCRICESPLCVRRRPPCLKRRHDRELIEKVVERTRTLMCRTFVTAKMLRQNGERCGDPSAHGIKGNLLGNPHGVLFRLPCILRDGAAHKVPRIRCRPLTLGADAKCNAVVLKPVYGFLPVAAGKIVIRCGLCHDRKKSRAQRTEYRIISPAAPCRLCGGAQKLSEGMMCTRTLCVQMAWDVAVGKRRQQQLRIGIHVAHEDGDLTIAIALGACEAQYV